MERSASAPDYNYILPARTLRGSTDELLAEIDEVVEGLLALRRLIAGQRTRGVHGGAHQTGIRAVSPPTDPTRRHV